MDDGSREDVAGGLHQARSGDASGCRGYLLWPLPFQHLPGACHRVRYSSVLVDATFEHKGEFPEVSRTESQTSTTFLTTQIHV